MRPRPHRPVDASFLSYIIPGALLVALGFLFFSNTTIDDAYTSLWPAWSLSHGRGIINYSGEHVEISSTLLWVLLIAFLNKSMGIGIVAAAYAAALIFGLAVTGLSTFVADQIKRGAGLYAGLLTATCLPVVNWSMSGMEMTLVAFLYLWTAYAWHLTLEKQRSPAFAILPTWLAIMVRPEILSASASSRYSRCGKGGGKYCRFCRLPVFHCLDGKRGARRVSAMVFCYPVSAACHGQNRWPALAERNRRTTIPRRSFYDSFSLARSRIRGLRGHEKCCSDVRGGRRDLSAFHRCSRRRLRSSRSIPRPVDAADMCYRGHWRFRVEISPGSSHPPCSSPSCRRASYSL